MDLVHIRVPSDIHDIYYRHKTGYDLGTISIYLGCSCHLVDLHELKNYFIDN